MDPFTNIQNEWRRRLESGGFNSPGPSQSYMRQPPPAHLQETMYVAERTASHSSASTPLTLAQMVSRNESGFDEERYEEHVLRRTRFFKEKN